MTKRARAVFQNMDGSHAPGATGNRQSARRSTSRTPVQADGWQLRALSNLSKSGGTRLAMGYRFRNPDHCASFWMWFTRSTSCPLIAVANRGAPHPHGPGDRNSDHPILYRPKKIFPEKTLRPSRKPSPIALRTLTEASSDISLSLRAPDQCLYPAEADISRKDATSRFDPDRKWELAGVPEFRLA